MMIITKVGCHHNCSIIFRVDDGSTSPPPSPNARRGGEERSREEGKEREGKREEGGGSCVVCPLCGMTIQ